MASVGSLLAIIADSLPEPVLIFSPQGRLEALNSAAASLTGLDATAAGAVTLAELLHDTAAAKTVLCDRDGPGGGKRAVSFPLTFYAPGCHAGALCGERWRISSDQRPAVGLRLFEPEAAQHRRVLARIAAALTAARGLPAAECQATGLAGAISEVCAFTGWAYAEAWVPAGADGASRTRWTAHPFWYGNREKYRSFRELSLKAAAAAPLPLVRRVARDRSALWFSDVSVVPLPVYRRARAARVAGLKATFAQPIVEGGRTLAVLVFMMAEARARDDALAGLMAAAARQLVPLFRTESAQTAPCEAARPRRRTDRHAHGEGSLEVSLLCQLLDGLGKAAVIVDDETRSIAWANAAANRLFGYKDEAMVGLPVEQLHADARTSDAVAPPAGLGCVSGAALRRRAWMRRQDGTRFASEFLQVPVGGVAGCRLSVSLMTDLGESARHTFGSRLDQLSSRELEVFQLTIAGATVTEIAELLALSTRTVEVHRSHLLHKLGCASAHKLLAELLADSVGQRAQL